MRRGDVRREWTEREMALVGTLSDAEVARRTGRTPHAVGKMRRKLGLMIQPHWRPAERDELGTAPDRVLAERLGRTVRAVGNGRLRAGRVNPQYARGEWTPGIIAQLGTCPDRVIAERLDVSPQAVSLYRRARGIAPYRRHAK